MKKFTFLKTLLMAVGLCMGVNAWGAGTATTLTSSYAVDGYKLKAYYNIGATNVDGICPTEGEVRFRGYDSDKGGNFGLYNFGGGSRSGAITVSVSEGDLVIFQVAGATLNSVSGCTANTTITDNTYSVWDVNSDAASLTIDFARYAYIVAILIMEEDTNPAYTINAVSGSTTLKTFASGNIAVGETYSTYIPEYVQYDGNYYVLDDDENANLSGYLASYTMGNSGDEVKEINYTLDESIKAFWEAENMSYVGHSWYSNGNQTDNSGCSNGGAKCPYSGTSNGIRSNSTIAIGVYDITIKPYRWGDAATDYTLQYSTDNVNWTTVETVSFASNSNDAYVADNIIIPGNSYLRLLSPSGSPRHAIDYIYAERTGDTPVQEAISDCKTHETSAAFATYIDGLMDEGSLTTTAEVYAAHTAWQIAQADAASSNDITKVIFDAQVSSNTRWNSARTMSNEQYTGAPDNTYFDAWNTEASDARQTIYGLPAGTYTIKVATRASADVEDKSKYNVWVNGGSADVSLLGNHIGNTGGCLGNGWNWTILSFTLDAEADVTIGFYARPADNLWASCDDWHLYKGTLTESATVTAAGWATFASPYALNLSSMTASKGTVEAYYASNATGSTVTLTSTNSSAVAAGEGLMLKGTAGATITIPVVASGSAIAGNLLKGQTTTGNVAASTSGKYHYVFGYNKSDATEYGFYKLTATTEVAAGKAYLETDTELSTATARLTIVFDEETTGIADVRSKMSDVRGDFFDLSGRKVAQPTKGLYIVNGKKVVIK